MESSVDSRTRSIVFLALLLLFFLQLLTAFIESIYRLSLIKLSPGKELFGLALLLLPLVLLAIKERHEKRFLQCAFVVFILARMTCPIGGARGQIIIGGTGISAFLVILCYTLSGPYGLARRNAGLAAGLAILASVALRVRGSSCDISMEKTAFLSGWVLVAIAAFSWSEDLLSSGEARHDAPRSIAWKNSVAVLGLFAQFAFLYWIFSSPAVPPAWAGCNYVLYTALLAGSLAIFVLGAAALSNLSSKTLIGWNLVLVALLVLGIRLHAPSLPLSPTSPAFFVFPAAWPTQIPFYALACLAPITMLGVGRAMEGVCYARPRNAVFPVLLGMGLLIVLSMIFIFTYVWGYVGEIGQLLRNQFYIPFLAAGLFSLPVWFLLQSEKPRAHGRNLVLGGVSVALAALSVAGVYWQAPRPAFPDPGDHPLTVVTFNNQQGSEENGNHSYREQLDLLRRLDADIIALQENDTARPSGGNTDCTRYFAEGLGYYAYYGPNAISGTYGTAILSRFRLENPRTFFTYSDQDENATAAAEFEVNGRRIAIFSNHPAGSDETRVAHAKALVEEAEKYPLAIAMGDFNFRQDEPWYGTVTAKLKDSWLSRYPDGIGKPHSTLKTANAGEMLDMRERIDHIFVSPGFEVLESYYLPPPESQTDHPIHWAVLRLK